MFLSDFRPISHNARSLALNTDLPLAQKWTAAAIPALNLFIANLTLKSGSGALHDLCEAALRVNFAWQKVPPGQRLQHATRVRAGFQALTTIYASASQRFTGASDEEARRHFPPAKFPPMPPAYALFHGRVFFTAAYQNFGPNCRAAMLIHECFHVVDRQSGQNNIHISEFAEPRFSNQSPQQKLHNPSAYASFAGQVFSNALAWPPSARFGAGNPSK